MKNNKKRNLLLSLILAAVCIVFLLYVDKFQHYSMLASVLKKGAIYSLVAVSLNLLNGFTGLFSLGQAGFMMIGAYTYAILTIPVEARASVYQYFDGGIGSIPGAVIGAFIIGICESFIKANENIAVFSNAFTFALLIIILLCKPNGLFGEKLTEKV